MHRILVDTCVWLDIAKDYSQRPLLSALEELVTLGILEFLVPRVILDEIDRNKTRVTKSVKDASKAALKGAKEVAEIYANDSERAGLMHQLNSLDIRLPILSDTVNDSMSRINALLAKFAPIETTDSVFIRAAKRASEKKAPFHRGQNQMNDAIIIETYADCIGDKSSAGIRYAFVTHNKLDYSASKGTQLLPHADIEEYFSPIRSRYFINFAQAIERIDPELVSDLMLESGWTPETRSLTDILAYEGLFLDKIWYGRHKFREFQINKGKIKLVDKEVFPIKKHKKRPIQRDVWEGALKAAERMEKHYGIEEMGPWTDFEWGMMNGKLSALRWVLGDDWDMLDT